MERMVAQILQQLKLLAKSQSQALFKSELN
jgi:hypothetical protein